MTKEIKLSAFINGYGHHIAAWRHHKSPTDAPMNYNFLLEQALLAEKGLFDFAFFADGLYADTSSHPTIAVKLEPITLATALSIQTKNIGIGITISTTYTEPYNVARYLASVDRISNGRVGWNIVTTVDEKTSASFTLKKHMEKETRYKRANEFVTVCKMLWKSWDSSYLIRNKELGVFTDKKVNKKIEFQGDFFAIKTLLNVENPMSNQPILIQAGTSKSGIELAAEHAEVVFIATGEINEAKKIYKKIKQQANLYGRKNEEILIMPGLTPILGETYEEAFSKYQHLQSLITEDEAMNILSKYLDGFDFTQYNLIQKFDSINFSKADSEKVDYLLEYAKSNQLSLIELARFVAGTNGHGYFIGTPKDLVNQMEEWITEKAADAFNIMPATFPDGLNDFVELVIPILQKRGLFRLNYKSDHLRGNLGLDLEINSELEFYK